MEYFNFGPDDKYCRDKSMQAGHLSFGHLYTLYLLVY